MNDKRTRAEIGIETLLKNNDNIGIIAIGNAPTALLKVIELFNSPAFAEQAASARGRRSRRVRQGRGIKSPACGAVISLHHGTGQKRRHAVAVAIVNALLKIAGEEK